MGYNNPPETLGFPDPIPSKVSKVEVISAAQRNASRIRRGRDEVLATLEDIGDSPVVRLQLASMEARALDWEAFANDIAGL